MKKSGIVLQSLQIIICCIRGARQRVLRLGEEPEFVFNTGCPSIDIAVRSSRKARDEF